MPGAYNHRRYSNGSGPSRSQRRRQRQANREADRLWRQQQLSNDAARQAPDGNRAAPTVDADTGNNPETDPVGGNAGGNQDEQRETNAGVQQDPPENTEATTVDSDTGITPETGPVDVNNVNTVQDSENSRSRDDPQENTLPGVFVTQTPDNETPVSQSGFTVSSLMFPVVNINGTCLW